MWDNPDRLYRSGCHLSAFLLNRLLNELLSFPHQVGKGLQPWRNVLEGKGRKEKLNICLEVELNWQGVGGCYVCTLACPGLQLLAYALRNSLLFTVFCMCAALQPLLLRLPHFRKGTNSSLARTHWLAGWSRDLEEDTWVFCFGVLFQAFFFFCLPDLAVRSSQILTLTWGTSFLVLFEMLPSKVPRVSTGMAWPCLQKVLERNWEQQIVSRPTFSQGQPVCPAWQGIICLRMYHPNVHSTLAYSMCLPSLTGQYLAALAPGSQMCYLYWSQEQPRDWDRPNGTSVCGLAQGYGRENNSVALMHKVPKRVLNSKHAP